MSVEIPKIEGLTRDQVLTLSRARKFEQYVGMIGDYLAGKCPFCDPLGPKNVVIREAYGWRMWKNPYPEKHTSLHLVLAPVRHITPKDAIGAMEFEGIGFLFSWVQNEFKIEGGGLLMRFGSPEFNAGTILHLHANIMVPDGTGEVRPPLAKEPEKIKAGIERLWVFEKLRQGASPGDLTPKERAFAGL